MSRVDSLDDSGLEGSKGKEAAAIQMIFSSFFIAISLESPLLPSPIHLKNVSSRTNSPSIQLESYGY
jgi:hypothetical protein